MRLYEGAKNLAMNGNKAVERCGHCDDTFMVIFDDAPRGFIEPCPMCAGGRLRSAEYSIGAQAAIDPSRVNAANSHNRNGKSTSKPDYFVGVDMTHLTWNRGLSLNHTMTCSRMGCNQPMDRPNTLCGGCKATRDQRMGVTRIPSFGEMLDMFQQVEHIEDKPSRLYAIEALLDEYRRKHSKHKTRAMA